MASHDDRFQQRCVQSQTLMTGMQPCPRLAAAGRGGGGGGGACLQLTSRSAHYVVGPGHKTCGFSRCA